MDDKNVQKEAIRLFNETWNHMDMVGRSDEKNAQMLHMAHASLWLWQQCGTPLNLARGEWQVSRVYSVLDMGDPALLFGMRSLEICLENAIEGIDLVFAYEAVARAYALLGDMNTAIEYNDMGMIAADTIADEDDRQYALNELATIGIA